MYLMPLITILQNAIIKNFMYAALFIYSLYTMYLRPGQQRGVTFLPWSSPPHRALLLTIYIKRLLYKIMESVSHK